MDEESGNLNGQRAGSEMNKARIEVIFFISLGIIIFFLTMVYIEIAVMIFLGLVVAAFIMSAGYLLSKTFKKVEQKRISNSIVLDECNRKLDICIENLKKANKYYD